MTISITNLIDKDEIKVKFSAKKNVKVFDLQLQCKLMYPKVEGYHISRQFILCLYSHLVNNIPLMFPTPVLIKNIACNITTILFKYFNRVKS